MKVVILAGGLGTRLQEETTVRPKPMVEIGDRPILWHVMKHYSHFGFHDFYICSGYLGNFIKQYFLDCLNLSGHLTIDYREKQVIRDRTDTEPWVVNVIDTGQKTNTGGRIRRLQKWLGDQRFMLTYGDGVSNVDLHALKRFHLEQGRMVTLTAVRPPARFGGLQMEGNLVETFTEKPFTGEGWVNGGYMVCEPQIFEYLTDDDCSFESHALQRLAGQNELAAYRHDGYWQCMDTLRELNLLRTLWDSGKAPWKVW